MPSVTFTSCPFSLFSPPVKNPLKCPASLTQCGTGRLSDSELCRLSVGYLVQAVMSENASDCTQNAAYRDRKLKKIMIDIDITLLIRPVASEKPQPNPTPSAPAPRFSRLAVPLHFNHLPPHISHFWLRACY